MGRYGNTFKMIRENKCLTQKYVSGDELSRSLYVKVEQGEVVPSVIKFGAILKKLNMGYDEFFFYIIPIV